MAAVYGALAGVLFGAMAVAVRVGLSIAAATPREAQRSLASVAALVALVAAAAAVGGEVSPPSSGRSRSRACSCRACPQLVMVQAIRHAGASRALIVVGVAPLLSVLLALVLLDEPFVPALAIGTVLVVAAGLLLAGERAAGALPPPRRRARAALRRDVRRSATTSSAGRPRDGAPAAARCDGDRRSRSRQRSSSPGSWSSGRLDAPPASRPGAAAFVVAGLCLGLAYAALRRRPRHGRVSVVAPLNATQSLWAVVFAALLLRRTEAIGRRVVLAALLVVAGGALIGVFR